MVDCSKFHSVNAKCYRQYMYATGGLSVCDIVYHRSSEYWDRWSDPDQTTLNYEQSEQGLHCFVIPPAYYTCKCIHCNKKVMYGMTD